MVLIGNKYDLQEDRAVESSSGQQVSQSMYVYVSVTASTVCVDV